MPWSIEGKFFQFFKRDGCWEFEYWPHGRYFNCLWPPLLFVLASFKVTPESPLWVVLESMDCEHIAIHCLPWLRYYFRASLLPFLTYTVKICNSIKHLANITYLTLQFIWSSKRRNNRGYLLTSVPPCAWMTIFDFCDGCRRIWYM